MMGGEETEEEETERKKNLANSGSNSSQGLVSPPPAVAEPSEASKGNELREDFVKNAVSFLTHPKVRTSDRAQKIAFLEKKGLSSREIEEAFARAELPQKSVAIAPPAQKGPFSVGQAAVPTSTSSIPTWQSRQHEYTPPFRQPPQPYGQIAVPRRRYRWTQIVVALGMITGTTILTIAVLRKYTAKWFFHIIYKLGLWLTAWSQPNQRIAQGNCQSLDEEDKLNQCVNSLNKTCQALQTMMETMKTNLDSFRNDNLKVEDKLSKMTDKWADVETRMLEGIENVLSQTKSSEKKSADSGNGLPFGYLAQPSSGLNGPKGNVSIEFGSASRASSQMPNGLHAPHSNQFQEIMQKVSRGEKIPGVREINDKPKGTNGITPSSLAPPCKPWENQSGVSSEIAFDTKEVNSLPWQTQSKGGKDKVDQSLWIPKDDSDKAANAEDPQAQETNGVHSDEHPKSSSNSENDNDAKSLKDWTPPPLVSEKPVGVEDIEEEDTEEEATPQMESNSAAASDANGSTEHQSLPIQSNSS